MSCSPRAGVDLDQLANIARNASDHSPQVVPQNDRAVSRSADKLSNTETVFSRANLLRWALAEILGKAPYRTLSRQSARPSRRVLEEASSDERAGRIDAIIDQWKSPGVGRDSAMILTTKNVDKHQLNDRACQVLRPENELKSKETVGRLEKVGGQREQTRSACHYQVNDIVRFQRRAKSLGISANQYLRVNSVDPD